MMSGDNRSIQVLNISNVNAQGKTVLNDGKLLELIQKYPFLYNRRVKGYNDKDYIDWAWKSINAAFNRSYANDPNAAFSTQCLITRWNVLKPLIQCLSKAYDMEAIPHSLRSSVVRICTELDDKSFNTVVKPYNSAQTLLFQNMSAIAELSMDKKLALEREVLDAILSTELEMKQLTKLKEEDWSQIREDTEDFINEIGYNQVLLTAVSDRKKMIQNNYGTQYKRKRRARTLGWVPLTKAMNFIKPCHVRVQRINMEDYMPLAKIIQLNKMKNEDLKPILPLRDSPGIFGF